MKKLIIFAIVLGFITGVASSVMAAGSVTYQVNKIRVGTEMVEEHVWSWTGDASDGTVPAKASDAAITGYVTLAVDNPGSTAPTTGYDVTITDDEGVDVFGTMLTDLLANTSGQSRPAVAAATDYSDRFVNSVLTMNLTNNSVNSATGTVTIYVRK